jgi:hypothetical protein
MSEESAAADTVTSPQNTTTEGLPTAILISDGHRRLLLQTRGDAGTGPGTGPRRMSRRIQSQKGRTARFSSGPLCQAPVRPRATACVGTRRCRIHR